ncbi:SpoIIE family protein phosphatase [Streptosporangium roseum]|uniref:SpoIIE family protein phosphatase n=1 Tax=Streptosporangium roseum TaxID=2001 RepID=UPI0033240E3C
MPAGFTGRADLLLIHRAAPNGPPLMLVSLVLAAATGTAVIGHFDPSDRTFSWISAGHPPPVLVRDGRATFLKGDPGTMLGVFEAMEYTVSFSAVNDRACSSSPSMGPTVQAASSAA